MALKLPDGIRGRKIVLSIRKIRLGLKDRVNVNIGILPAKMLFLRTITLLASASISRKS
jgi:hypothetical protein